MFHLNDTSDVAPSSTPAAFMSVCPKQAVKHPAACLLARACQRLWLFDSDGAFGGSLVLDLSLSLALPPPRAGSDRDRLTAFSVVIRQRYVVSTAFDPAVTSYADVDRLLRTEPQVQLTPFVLNNHPNSFKSHTCLLSATPPLKSNAVQPSAGPPVRHSFPGEL